MFDSSDALDDHLSEPTPGVIESIRRLDGTLLVLGAGGKMGLDLCAMAQRAATQAGSSLRVVAVSRFSSEDQRARFERYGVDTIRCNLMEPSELERLPDAGHVLSMVGTKFGTSGNASFTWATNCVLPANVCRRFPQSSIAAFSTGNVYPHVPIDSGGSKETDPVGPVGEYAMTALGRERVYDYYSRELSIPMTLIRLNYATELRYGVLVDIARQVHAGEPVSLDMGYFNVIWQRDACAISLQAFERASSPPFLLNLTGPETLSVRETAEWFGKRFGRDVRFVGQEGETALLNNASLAIELYGKPGTAPPQIMELIADWLEAGRPLLGKPTHFGSRDGAF